MSDDVSNSTKGGNYTERLIRLEGRSWKQLLDVQRPYRWNLRRWDLGRTLDIGCGIGRNLATLPPGSVGVDHNPDSVAACQARGLTAFVPEDFHKQGGATQPFQSLLIAHVLEHLSEDVGYELFREYLPHLQSGGRVVVITPQERGYATDDTHVRFVGPPEVASMAAALGLRIDRQYSFPFPRPVGKIFYANEFVTVATYVGPANRSEA